MWVFLSSFVVLVLVQGPIRHNCTVAVLWMGCIHVSFCDALAVRPICAVHPGSFTFITHSSNVYYLSSLILSCDDDDDVVARSSLRVFFSVRGLLKAFMYSFFSSI